MPSTFPVLLRDAQRAVRCNALLAVLPFGLFFVFQDTFGEVREVWLLRKLAHAVV